MFRSPRSHSDGVIARAEARAAQRGAATARIVILTITGFLIGALWLATATRVPELVRAHGELVPLGHAQQIQAPEQGIVSDVSVKEGETVIAGQILTRLASPALDQAMDEAVQERKALALRLENLHLIAHHADDPAGFETATTGGGDLSYASAQLDLFAAQQRVQIRLRDHLETTRKALQTARDLTAKRIASRQDRIERAEHLFDRSLMPRRDLDQLRDGLDQLLANQIEIEIRLSQAQKDIASAGSTLDQNKIALLERTNAEMFDAEERLAQLDLQIAALKAREAALEIRAPAAGVVHAVAFPNAGEVIATGTTLFELMPTGPQLVAQLEIDPVDIGHIKRGDAVALKFDTYDARRYGQIDGEIASISPNSVIDEQTGLGHFRATVRLNSASIGQGVWQRPLQAGMGTSAEIVTDDRTVLAYLIKPISRSFGNAFGER